MSNSGKFINVANPVVSNNSSMQFVAKASVSLVGLLLLLISNSPAKGFQLTNFNLYENDNLTAPQEYMDFTNPDDYHKLRLEYSLSNGEEFKSLSIALGDVEVFWLVRDQAPILKEPFNEDSIRFLRDDSKSLFDIDILKPTVDFEGIYDVEVKTTLNGQEEAFKESKEILMQYRCSEFVSSTETSEPNCLIQITLGCKERLYPKFWKKEAFAWSTEKNEFRVDFTNWKKGQTFADGTYSYFLEDKYEITPESPFGLSVNSTFSFGAFRNMSFSTDSTATFQAFDFDGCPSYEKICQSPPGELVCRQVNDQEPRIKCRNYVVSSRTNEKAKLTFECPEDCDLQLEGQVISEPTLVYECDEPAHLWRNTSGQSLPTSLPTCDCPERGGGHLSSTSQVLSYCLPLIIGMMNFLQKQ